MKDKMREIKLPPFDKVSIYSQYGISKKLFIDFTNIVKPYKIHAHCCDEHEYFEFSEKGYEEARLWLESKRLRTLKLLGVEIGDIK